MLSKDITFTYTTEEYKKKAMTLRGYYNTKLPKLLDQNKVSLASSSLLKEFAGVISDSDISGCPLTTLML